MPVRLERRVGRYGMSEKKIVAFIVEGPSDEAALGTIMKEYFSNNEVRFVVVYGDITLKDYVSADSVLKRINEQIDSVRGIYRYKWGDFIKIIHIVDTDGTYIPETCVKESDGSEEEENVNEENAECVQYYEDHIETRNVKASVARIKKKGEVLYKLRKTGKVHGIPYRIYFNSCNLEHVLYGELKNHSDEEKKELSDDLADKYEGRVDEFIEFISDSAVAVPGTYQKTWDYIEKDVNSLNRHTNMHLIFEERGK